MPEAAEPTVPLATCQNWHDLPTEAEIDGVAKLNAEILMKGGFFSPNAIAGSPPPDWLVAALSEQVNRLGVDIQHARPDLAANHLTRRTSADLEPKVRELAKAAKTIRLFVVGARRSKKSKEDQRKSLIGSLRVLRALVGNGVLYGCLFDGAPLGVPVRLPCDDDQFVACLEIVEAHVRGGAVGELALVSGQDELLACLEEIESLARRRLAIRQRRQPGRPKKASVPPQLRCVVVVEIARREWPDFRSTENDMCEAFWKAAHGRPHTQDGIKGSELYEVWRRDWIPNRGMAPLEIRRDVEDSFSAARRRHLIRPAT